MTKGIWVVGIGDAGCQALEVLEKENLTQLRLLGINTYAAGLARIKTFDTLHIGTSGLGAGGNPSMGAQAAQYSQDAIRQKLGSDYERAYLIAGLGGGTGSGAAPIIAETLKFNAANVYAVVSLPTSFEGTQRKQTADQALAQLVTTSLDDILVVKGDHVASRLLPNTPDLRTMMTIFARSLAWHLLAHITG
ncbi:hypothetical protein G4Y79_11670 [Phototrophicus methaneseepsis]|uniref:Tubulin/FtsZ GTPase domain-containing protein n=1 Tax=Phototrophicus methaneseepsis TaxID=2710758 RepID=A0A7S8EDK0_9CHLR|nr:hypothetical protein [Phototrophicus methaneseepsis]QPC84992.1 hypothetical protein G4Y79_11670 [Phototrophicus methaneseepsis]